MRGIIITVIFFITNFITVNAQNFITREHILFSELLYNPAVVGSQDDIVAVISVKRNWIGVKEAPSTSLLSLHTNTDNMGFSSPKKYISNLSSKIGLGLNFYNDRNGPLSTNGIQLSYAFHFSLYKDINLSMGLSTKVTNYALDETEFRAINIDDPIISWNKEQIVVPNCNSGIRLYNKKYFLGFSSTNIVDFNKKTANIYYEENIRTFYCYGGYKFFVDKSVVEPIILIRSLKDNIWYDVSLKFIYKDFCWISVTYENEKLYSVNFAVIYKQLCFGYGFEYSLSPIYKYTYGNHQAFIGYNLK